MALKKSELYSSLWASCDALRGGMDASQYKDYVLVLLFVKYVSDKYAGQPFAPITIPKGASFADMVALKGKSDIGDRINKQVLGPLAAANKLSEMPDFNDATKLGSGKEMVERLSDLIGIFETPALNFSKNRADGDDILGDAYEYLMRHFATESGKSKGQFYTPAEVSRIMAQIVGIANAKTKRQDDRLRSDLRVRIAAAQGGGRGQVQSHAVRAREGLGHQRARAHEYDLARQPDGRGAPRQHPEHAAQLKDDSKASSRPSTTWWPIRHSGDKRWSTGVNTAEDPHERFVFGVPPDKQGDYAYLLHILRSLKSTGKGACILPHGVLFRGGAEGAIRKNLIGRGYIKSIIGLPANLFYGTGIPACIIVIDKEQAATRKAIFMIDASKGFAKDGPKNRLREQDIHRIVDVFTRELDVPGFSRLVPVAEVGDSKNDFNLNLPRYIDSSEPDDLQDIDGHLRGGIPNRDIDALDRYWKVIPGVRAALFKKGDRAGYSQLRVAPQAIKATIFGHEEFTAFNTSATNLFTKWKKANAPQLQRLRQERPSQAAD